MKNNKRTQTLKRKKKEQNQREASQTIPGQSPQGEAYQPPISEA